VTAGYRVIPARPEDVRPIQSIERAAARLFPPEDLPPAARGDCTPCELLEAARRAGLLWVAVAGEGAPVGFAHARDLGDDLHLQELDVHPDHGRRGLGTALLGTVLAEAERRGYAGVSLTTFAHLPWNAPFYARHGFRPVPPEARSPGLAQAFQVDLDEGLDPARRVAMRYPVRGA